ncbi:hypothetical protein [Bacillus pumilus]|nr:hypothetical protein [Bacillus pumilus]
MGGKFGVGMDGVLGIGCFDVWLDEINKFVAAGEEFVKGGMEV